jgi:ubiquitin-protein ligase
MDMMNLMMMNNQMTNNSLNQAMMINQMNNQMAMNQMNNAMMMNNMMNPMNNMMNPMNNMGMINPMNMMNNIIKQQMNMINQMNQMNMVNQATQAMTLTRLKKEFSLCSQDIELKGLGCQFILENNNYYIWRVTLKGPKETPYEGGTFTIRITFPFNYPKSGPEFRFLNLIYHLNVDFNNQNELGHICLNYLNEWKSTGKVVEKPGYGVKQALIDIFCLFYNQNIKSAYDINMAAEYQSNMSNFNSKAKMYTQKYAQQAMLN